MDAADRITRGREDAAALRLLLTTLAPVAAPPEQLARLAAEADWTRLLGFARRHRVAPRLGHALAEAGVALPPAAEEPLERARRRAVLEEAAQASLLRRIAARLNAAQLDWVVLKSVPLSLRLHGRLGLRTSRDIDLLVDPAQLGPAFDALAGIGLTGAPTARDSESLARLTARSKDIELTDAGSGLIVELHWRLFENPTLLPLGSPLPQREVVLGPGWTSLPLLPIATELRYLALHGCQHGWSRLKWLADFAAALGCADEQTLASLVPGTRTLDGRRALESALLLCATLLPGGPADRLAAQLHPDLRTRLLLRSALDGLAASGMREIEDLPFGSTRKNVTHYLISAAPTYLKAELSYDLRPPARSGARRTGPIARVAEWLSYQRRRGAQ